MRKTRSTAGRTTQRRADGAVLWECDECGEWLVRGDFAQRDAKRGYTCKRCAAGNVGQAPDGWALSKIFAPKDSAEGGKIIWKYLRVAVKGSGTVARARTIERVFNPRLKLPPEFRRPILQLFADMALPPETNFWLAFQAGAMSPAAHRQLAAEWARQAAQEVKLEEEYPTLEEVVIDSLGEAADTGDLLGLRKEAYALLQHLDAQEFVPKSKRSAALALAAASLKDARDAAASSLNWSYEAFIAADIDPEEALAELNGVLSRYAEAKCAAPENSLRHWEGLERL